MLYYTLILFGLISRLLPHPPNFSPVAAIALFSAHYLKDQKKGFLIPLIILFLTDWKIGLYQWQLMTSVYISFGLVFALGWVGRKKSWLWSLPTAVVGSGLFFLVTNFAFWRFGGVYPPTTDGLLTCYLQGIPFYRNTLFGDVVFVFAFFGLAELVRYSFEKKPSKVTRFLLAQP